MSQTPPPPPAGGDPEQPPPTTATPQDPAPQGWQPGWQESWQPTTPGQPTYSQPPYGQAPSPQVPYGAPQAPAYGAFAPDHPQSTLVLILGILGLVLCQLISPFAWVMGNRVVREIDASGGAVGGRSAANAGRICGIIGTALIGLAFLVVIVVIVVGVAASA
jgi:hypothetical protein